MIETVVKSCQEAKFKTNIDGKKTVIKGFDVILEDTVLFPEGGGQPDDRGMIGESPVLSVRRQGAEAIHFVLESFDAGQAITAVVNWDRRWDNMQQHSGQHLITAIADDIFGFSTTSWNLGEKMSFIELDTPNMTPEQMETLERTVNEKIMASIPMYPTLYSGVDDPKLSEARTRGLPEDHVGPVRVVTIEGIESNSCCGTHVSNLAHLQIVKLLTIEKGKKGKVNLVFVAGQRVLNYLSGCYQREKAFTTYLKGGPDQHVQLLDKLTKNTKETKKVLICYLHIFSLKEEFPVLLTKDDTIRFDYPKNETMLLRDVAKLEVQVFLNTNPRPPVLALHRKEGDMDFINMVMNEVNDENTCVFVSCGDVQGVGMFLVSAPEHVLSQHSQKILELLEGKGANKKKRLQGKANKLGQRGVVIDLLKNAVENNKSGPV